MSMLDTVFVETSWHYRGITGALLRPGRNIVGNIIQNPGHQEGQPYIGFGSAGGQGKRDQALGSLAMVTAPIWGPSSARFIFKNILTKRFLSPANPLTMFQKISMASTRALSIWGIGASVDNARTAYDMDQVAFRDPSKANIRRTYNALGNKTPSFKDAMISTPYEVPFSWENTKYGKIGDSTDVAGFFAGVSSRMSTQKLAGKDPFKATTLLKNIGTHAIELTIGQVSRKIEKVHIIGPIIKKMPFSGELIGWVGGASQAMLSGPTEEEKKQASQNMESRWPWLSQQ